MVKNIGWCKLINIIAAVSLNNCIGINNTIPWKIKEDMQFFKRMTTNNVVIMGRKTYESIGKPLPNRENIVITSSRIDGVVTFTNLKDAIESNKSKNIFLIGGSKIYEEGLQYADKMYITLVNKIIDGDCFFDYKKDKFILVKEEKLSDDATLKYFESL